MTKTIRAILIDSFKKEIKEIFLPSKSHEFTDAVYAALGCETFNIATYLENGDALFVDDEGLLKDPKHFFVTPFYPQPLAGRGLIVGTGKSGKSISAKTDVEMNVMFVGRNDLRLYMESEQKLVDRMRKEHPEAPVMYVTMKEALEE